MRQRNLPLCVLCRVRHAQEGDTRCRRCEYQSMVRFERALPADERDWSFATCQECGSSFDNEGICRNQSCGASPDLGKDWL